MRKRLFTVLLLGLVACPGGVFADTGFNGLIINNSSNPLADRIVDLLTARWYFDHNAASDNLLIKDVDGGPGSRQIAFMYGGEVIKKYDLPRANLHPENLDKVADEIYARTVKIDIARRTAVLERLSRMK